MLILQEEGEVTFKKQNKKKAHTFRTGATLFNDEHSALQPHVIFTGLKVYLQALMKKQKK